MKTKKPTTASHALTVPDNPLPAFFIESAPMQIREEGRKAIKRFGTFFTDEIRNEHTRAAYYRAVMQFFAWCQTVGLDFRAIESYHISAYIEQLMKQRSVETTKQHLAAIRKLYDWLIIGQITPINPAHAVRGPRLSIKKGKTPILDAQTARHLLDCADTSHVVGLRDRALISLMIYTFARVSAALRLDVKDYYSIGKTSFVHLTEKRNKEFDVPVNHKLVEYLDEYIAAADIADQKKGPLFRASQGKTRKLTNNRLNRNKALAMIRRRAKDAGIDAPICCHTFRGTGITEFLNNGGQLETAQLMAGHESPRTTKLYDRTSEVVEQADVERIII